ncbi:vancomycin high temperature exclusion protein [Patescibacteria group bacterium]
MSIPVKKTATIAALVILFLVIGLTAILWHVRASTDQLIYNYKDIEEVEERPAAIVFGAAVNPNTQLPSDILQDRIITAVDLYNKGKVEKLLMSGDNRVTHYNEPIVMKRFGEILSVDEDDLIMDFAGRRTYDTCYRAKEIFGLDKVILVTQEYHLYRALYTCRALGLDVIGVSASRQKYIDQSFYNLREIPATLLAFLEVHITRPKPILGEKIEVFE